MVEKKTKMQAWQVHAFCECGGEISVTQEINSGMGGAYTSDGKGNYEHRCDKCMKEEFLPKIYPYMMHEIANPTILG